MLDFSLYFCVVLLFIFKSEKNLNGLIVLFALGICFVALHFSITSSTVNSEPLCGELLLGNYTSTSNSFTLHFVSDNTITARGFEVVFVAIEPGKLS